MLTSNRPLIRTISPRQTQNIGWLKPGEQRTVTWTVRGAGPVTVSIASTRGGVDSRTLTVR